MRILKFMTFAMVFAWAFGIVRGPVASAQGSASAKAASEKDKRKTSIDFEDELIQGEVKKPELFYLLQKKQFNFKRLIKLREDFLPEMRRTSQDIRRSGSGN
ncbi:MAG: hypothetical protein AB7N80_04535 [Bdellovibrionales bacterium]